VKLTIYLHLVPRSRIRGSIHPLPQYAFMAWFSFKAQEQLYLYLYGEDLLSPIPTPKLEDHPLLAVLVCLFNIFAATLPFLLRLCFVCCIWTALLTHFGLRSTGVISTCFYFYYYFYFNFIFIPVICNVGLQAEAFCTSMCTCQVLVLIEPFEQGLVLIRERGRSDVGVLTFLKPKPTNARKH